MGTRVSLCRVRDMPEQSACAAPDLTPYELAEVDSTLPRRDQSIPKFRGEKTDRS